VAELNADALSGWAATYASINFLHFAALLFVLCTAVLVVVSLSAPAPPPDQLAGLTYASTPPTLPGAHPAPRLDLGLSIVLVALVAAIWLYF